MAANACISRRLIPQEYKDFKNSTCWVINGAKMTANGGIKKDSI
jgi:hypothetical protein